MKYREFFCSALILCAAISSPALADGSVASPPDAAADDPFDHADPTKIIMPNLVFTPDEKIVKKYHIYFYFHKNGVDFATALADIRECEYYSTFGEVTVAPPTFVPYGGELQVDRKANKYKLQPGLMPLVFAPMVMGPLLRRMHNAGMRNCMAFRDYSRYGLNQEISESIDNVGLVEQVLTRAKIASGPKPASESIEP